MHKEKHTMPFIRNNVIRNRMPKTSNYIRVRIIVNEQLVNTCISLFAGGVFREPAQGPGLPVSVRKAVMRPTTHCTKYG